MRTSGPPFFASAKVEVWWHDGSHPTVLPPTPPELSQLDWLGNRAADGLAGEALRRCGPAPPLRDLWESRVRLARGVARVAAAVLEASLEDLRRLAMPDVRPLVRRRAGRAV